MSKLSYGEIVQKIRNEINEEKKGLSFEARSTKLLEHGNKQERAILVLHGLFQSPKDQMNTLNELYREGFNVYCPLLLGHWRKDPKAFYKLSPSDWLNQVEESYKKLLELGQKVYVLGHSTGGLLAYQLGLKYQDRINGIVLIAPAIKLKFLTRFGIYLGLSFGLTDRKSTGIDIEYDSSSRPAYAGKLVQDLIESIFGKNKMSRNRIYRHAFPRTLIFTTTHDKVVDSEEVKNMVETQKKNSELKLFQFEFENIAHDSIQRGPIDVVEGAPSSWTNPKYHEQIEMIKKFLKD